MYVKLKRLKDKKGKKRKRINKKQKKKKITLKEDREYTKNMRIPAPSLRAAHKTHPSLFSAFFFWI